MRVGRGQWALAIGLSCAVHAGAAVLVLPRIDEVQIAGGEETVIALAGTAFVDLRAAGAPGEVIEPVEEPAEALLPEEPDPAAVQPIEPALAETAAVLEPKAPDIPSTESEAAEPVEPLPPDISEAPLEAEETFTAMLPIPRPTPRPDYTPPARDERQAEPPPPAQKRAEPPEERKTEQQRAQRRAKSSAGSGGRDTENAKRGNAETGSANGGNTGKGRASGSGNAVASNYPGKVVTKLRRSLRYPSEARRERLRGEVHVAFTVTSSGSVNGIRIVRSSGSPVLDRAAVETVQRAAPFPAIPAETGRSSWPFTVPLAFVR